MSVRLLSPFTSFTSRCFWRINCYESHRANDYSRIAQATHHHSTTGKMPALGPASECRKGYARRNFGAGTDRRSIPPYGLGIFIGELPQVETPDAPMLEDQSLPDRLAITGPTQTAYVAKQRRVIPCASTANNTPGLVSGSSCGRENGFPVLDDYKHVARLPHHSSHRPASPPAHMTQWEYNHIDEPGVWDGCWKRWFAAKEASLVRDAGIAMAPGDLRRGRQLVQPRASTRVQTITRAETLTKLEGRAWDRTAEERRDVGRVIRRLAGARIDRDNWSGRTLVGETADAVGEVLSSGAVLISLDDARTKFGPCLRGGRAECGGDANVLERGTDLSHWSESTQGIGCSLAKSVGVLGTVKRKAARLRGFIAKDGLDPGGCTPQRVTGLKRLVPCRRHVQRFDQTARERSDQSSPRGSALNPPGKIISNASHSTVFADFMNADAGNTETARKQVHIPPMPSRAFEGALSIKVTSAPPSASPPAALRLGSIQQPARLDKPLPPIPGQGLGSSERAKSCAVAVETVDTTSSPEEALGNQVSSSWDGVFDAPRSKHVPQSAIHVPECRREGKVNLVVNTIVKEEGKSWRIARGGLPLG